MLSAVARQQMLTHLYVEEGYEQFAYDDATRETVKAQKGSLTVGIGWNIQSNGCPREIAEYVAMYFVNKVDLALSKTLSFYDRLDDVRKVVLCDMGFNMGVTDLLKFQNMLNAIAKQDFQTAAICMLNSVWANQVKMRAIKLSHMLEKGQWIQS